MIASMLALSTGGSPKKSTFQIQISALIQTTYCIQFGCMQFHMIRCFSLSSMCIKLCVVTHSSFKSDNEFQRTTVSCLNRKFPLYTNFLSRQIQTKNLKFPKRTFQK